MHVVFSGLKEGSIKIKKSRALALEPEEGSNALILVSSSFDPDQVVCVSDLSSVKGMTPFSGSFSEGDLD